ncbi:DUF6325 family protein [Curtobacterium sp. PhB136]|uniref:DUF6325 family protein n=1 Tax=Curtobacterium sp. PhB136 TaxID=2485181 RepID=UPI001047AC36|nr:DUF6325 family protein [Curtobacterium sp. PhB136]TCK63800.1 hypothetical protein EDF27_2347 [Curtobacterium sp. PhB136]
MTVTAFDFGPAEVYIIRYPGVLPDPGVLEALAALVADSTVRLLDILVVSRAVDGAVSVLEIDDLPTDGALGEVTLDARGLAGNDDVDSIADGLTPGMSAAIAVMELLWAKNLAERFSESGGELLETVRVPAPELNELAAAAHIK